MGTGKEERRRMAQLGRASILGICHHETMNDVAGMFWVDHLDHLVWWKIA